MPVEKKKPAAKKAVAKKVTPVKKTSAKKPATTVRKKTKKVEVTADVVTMKSASQLIADLQQLPPDTLVHLLIGNHLHSDVLFLTAKEQDKNYFFLASEALVQASILEESLKDNRS